jgi:SAM-dependent methyltransferase
MDSPGTKDFEAKYEYAQTWERFWADLPIGAGEALWDGDPALNTGAHLSKFQPFFAADMPLLDIGCGNGSQTIFLSGHYRRVIGLDFSPSAIENAVAHGSAVAEFRQFDLLDEVSVTALHRELGDCNVRV